ncbi:Mu transposase C-terminal domain-containing protein [Streptomyces hydrogenans]|uniref:Mu transposase C-terminal domain-containing protein n=1 Tax=Streptomyces hydrogenans TaxID=1873719 RepID=UPI0036D0626A
MTDGPDINHLRTTAVSRLLRLDATGELTPTRLTGVADAFGVHPRTVTRWIEKARANNGTYTPTRRESFELTLVMRDAVVRWRGNATAAYRELKADQIPGLPSPATFHRAATRAFSPGQRAGLRHGENARRAYDIAGKRPRHHRNYSWETDHVEASVRVRIDGHIRKPWITFFADSSASAICGCAITPQRPSREAVLVAIRDAVLIDDHHGPFGGIPDRVIVDGGKEFLSTTVGQALGAMGTERIELPPYSPEGKPVVEAVNKAIKITLFAGMPGYTHAPTLLGNKPVDPDQPLLHFEAFVARVRTWIHWWNHENTIRDLGNRTPAQAWNDDPTPIETIDPSALHTYTLERHGKPLTINNTGVRWKGADYIADWMHGYVGQKVTLRYLPHHNHRVELYNPANGHHLGPAHMANQATPQQIRDLKRAQRREADRLRAALTKAEKNRNIRYAAETEARPPTPLTALPEDQVLTHLRDLDAFDARNEALPDLLPLPEPADDWIRPQPAPDTPADDTTSPEQQP